MTEKINFHAINIRQFAQQARRIEATQALGDFARVCEDVPAESDISATQVRWNAQGYWRNVSGDVVAYDKSSAHALGTPWLHLQLETEVPRTCQRCLKPVVLPVQVDRDFRFVADEATAEAEDEDSEEDVLVASTQFDLLGLVEDEILLDLPLIPLHESCEGPIALQQGEEMPPESDTRQPFANLADMLKTVAKDKK